MYLISLGKSLHGIWRRAHADRLCRQTQYVLSCLRFSSSQIDRDRLHPRLDYFRPIFGLSDLVFYQSLRLTDTTVRVVHNTQVVYTHRWHQQIV